MHVKHDHDPLQPHRHDPNFTPPSMSSEFTLSLPDGRTERLDLPDLQRLPTSQVANCYIVSTGHGTSGPFIFEGVRLIDLIEHYLGQQRSWSEVEVISNDGFGNRVMVDELRQPDPAGPILLAYAINGQLMTRQQGRVRMIVPSEKDDALRQVKWVGRINVQSDVMSSIVLS